jgi:hypothetical protein
MVSRTGFSKAALVVKTQNYFFFNFFTPWQQGSPSKAKGFSGFSPRSVPHNVIGGLASIYYDGLNPSP